MDLVCIRAIHNYEIGQAIRPEDVERYKRLYWHSVVERELPPEDELEASDLSSTEPEPGEDDTVPDAGAEESDSDGDRLEPDA